MIASPPIRSICPRQTRSSRFSDIRSGSVRMTWNFRLELPEFSTRIFIGRFSDLASRVYVFSKATSSPPHRVCRSHADARSSRTQSGGYETFLWHALRFSEVWEHDQWHQSPN